MREKSWPWRLLRPNLWVRGLFLLLIICAPFSFAGATTPSAATLAAEGKDPAVTVDRQVLEEVVNKALEQQLAPVKEMLTELTVHQTSLPDILGGIGYIMGFFGIWAYFQSKRKRES